MVNAAGSPDAGELPVTGEGGCEPFPLLARVNRCQQRLNSVLATHPKQQIPRDWMPAGADREQIEP